MTGYATKEEEKRFNELLDIFLDSSISFWIATRINGCSASMCANGNENAILIKAFDKIRSSLKGEA